MVMLKGFSNDVPMGKWSKLTRFITLTLARISQYEPMFYYRAPLINTMSPYWAYSDAFDLITYKKFLKKFTGKGRAWLEILEDVSNAMDFNFILTEYLLKSKNDNFDVLDNYRIRFTTFSVLLHEILYRHNPKNLTTTNLMDWFVPWQTPEELMEEMECRIKCLPWQFKNIEIKTFDKEKLFDFANDFSKDFFEYFIEHKFYPRYLFIDA